MALFESMTGVDGDESPLAGLLPGKVVMQKRLAGLGMQEVVLPEGVLRGHAFHYSRAETALEPLCITTRADGQQASGLSPQAADGELHAPFRRIRKPWRLF